jgi:hypothetical protein
MDNTHLDIPFCPEKDFQDMIEAMLEEEHRLELEQMERLHIMYDVYLQSYEGPYMSYEEFAKQQLDPAADLEDFDLPF